MISTILSSAASLAILLWGSALSGDATYELVTSVEGDQKTYAVVNSYTGDAVVADVDGDSVSILKGADALTAMESLNEGGPEMVTWATDEGNEFVFEGDGDVNVMVMKDGDHDVKVVKDGEKKVTKKVKVIEIDGVEDRAKAEAILKEHGVDVSVLDEGEGDGKRKVVIKKVDSNTTVDIEGDVDVKVMKESDGKVVKKRVMKMKSPETPETPATPETDGYTESKMVSKWVSKSDDNGVEKTFIRMKGVDADDAREFVEDIDDLSASQKAELTAVIAS